AVLLLQPDVSLYSTDALPANCSVSPGPPQLSPQYEMNQQQHTPSSSRYVCPSGLVTPIPRTCECLTQTLCCHGCGTAVGYMVVIPCRRCCSSVTPADQHIARHRFVFFTKEIRATIRHYISSEPGIHSYSLVPPSISNPSSSSARSARIVSNLLQDQEYRSSDDRLSSSSPLTLVGFRRDDRHSPHTSRPTTPYGPRPPSHNTGELKPQRGRLRGGDVLYWHNLAKTGEIPAVTDDERARHPYSSSSVLAGR
ncbi:hypothetical protein M422DRAFT_192045, partial [Sphaerobolus stellatus SS14]